MIRDPPMMKREKTGQYPYLADNSLQRMYQQAARQNAGARTVVVSLPSFFYFHLFYISLLLSRPSFLLLFKTIRNKLVLVPTKISSVTRS
jgi:hypothetical protein